MKDCDVDIIKMLAAKELLFAKENMSTATRIAGAVILHCCTTQQIAGLSKCLH